MTTVEEFLSSYSPQVRALTLEARDLVFEAIPDALEMVDPPSKIIAYGFSQRYADLICALAPYRTYINLIFSRGTELPDPQGLLSGTGKRARHVRIDQVESIREPGIRNLLTAAVALYAKGKPGSTKKERS